MAKVLVVTNTPHLPATSGYSQRVSAVITALEAAGHRVRTVAIKADPKIQPITPTLSEVRSHFALSPGRLLSCAKVLARLFRTPSASLLKWYSPKACDGLAAIAKRWHPDVVVLESSYLAPYQVLFHCPVIFDLHNIESQLISNYAKDRTGLVAKAAHFESKLLERFEATIPHKAFGVATVSDTDRLTLQQLSVGSTPIVAAPNGVTDEAFTVTNQLELAAGPTVVFIGHLGWRPNIDGARWLANQVWPRVTAQVKNAQLQIIGRDPSPQVLELADPDHGLSVHGNVDSVFPYLAAAAVATAPLWTAGGTRLKILEALGTGTPVVATSLGALGLEGLAEPQVLTITDNPAEFAAALVEYLEHPAKSTPARQAAEAYRWPNTLASLVEMVNDAAV